eukprot:4408182-Heterocapsa_arctica.AAC.1
MCFVRFLLVDPIVVQLTRQLFPDVPMHGGRAVHSDRASRGEDSPRSLPEQLGEAHPRDDGDDDPEEQRATQWR